MSVVSERTFSNRRRSLNRAYQRPPGNGPAALNGNRSVIGGGANVDRHFLLPQFSAAASEGIPHPMDDRWADENTTVVTGASELSYNEGAGNEGHGSLPAFPPPPGNSLARLLLRRCSWLCWLLSSFLISFLAFVSAPLMAALPHALGQLELLTMQQPEDRQQEAQWSIGAGCDVGCQGQLLNLGGKTALLFLALYVLFWRRSAADMPRLFLHRAAFAFFVFFVLFAFWLFYIVRILLEKNTDQTYVLSFALSLVDILLFIHCIWIFFELRQFRPVFSVQILRDPDGECQSHELGQMSIQEAAVVLLRLYRVHFPIFNAQLAQARRSSTAGRFRSIPAPTGFKLYDIDGRGDGGAAALTEMNARILMQAASQRRMAGHNELFHEECEWERRYRKRKCKLISCAEEIFAQVQATEGRGPNSQVEPMDLQRAAKAVLSSITKQLNRFSRFTRQDRLHSQAQVFTHLQRCLAFGFSARTFLQPFFSNSAPIQEVLAESKWSILCDCRVSGPLRHGLTFVLRCHDSDGFDRGVQLLCSTSAFPFLNLTEQPSPHKTSFQLKVLPGNTAELGV